jgi:adenine deaminase
MNLEDLISVARGESPADLLFLNARIVNTLTAEIETGSVVIHQGRVAGIGDYQSAKQVLDLKGNFLAPGLIEGHTHLESSMLHLSQYARAVVPRGVTTLITDLHEIANVCGLEGMKYIKDCARQVPMDVFFLAPSCVPATHLETSGARLGSEDIKRVLRWENVLGLGEVMNFPGVLFRNADVLGKIIISRTKVIDGHAPGLRGKNLNAYIASGIGSDHESTTLQEGEEKLRRGMHLMIREGSSEKNLDALLPLATDKTYHRCFFVVDDRSCTDILKEGSIDSVVRKAIRKGFDPLRAIQMATINPAEYFRLYDLGAIAPGFIANLMVLTDLAGMETDMVFYRGKKVAEKGVPLFSPSLMSYPRLQHTFNIKPFTIDKLKLTSHGNHFPVIELIPGQIVTRQTVLEVKVQDGVILPDSEKDILKLVVVERHKATGNIGLGLVKGFGLRRGALASSVAHDSHNIIAVGTNDMDIMTAVDEVERMQGGLVTAAEAEVLASLPLPIAGLLSDEPLEKVVASMEKLEHSAATHLGATHPTPFAILAFLALPVIPELKLTDLGLVDVAAFRLIDLHSFASQRE